MEKFDELLGKLKDLEIIQKSGDWEEDMPDDIWEEYLKDNLEEIDSELDVDKHRWYETSQTVYKIFGRYLGVTSVTDLFSESMSVSDCYETLYFEEVFPTTVTTFK